MKNFPRIPPQGLYDPQHEHDACGVGFVVDIKGRRSHQILTDALHILNNLRHRGAGGCETNTGDGAGVLFQVPHEFLKVKCGQVGFALPDCGQYGVGMVYLPPDPADRYKAVKLFEEIAAHAGLELIGWRTVPTNDYTLGKTARYSEPMIRQTLAAVLFAALSRERPPTPPGPAGSEERTRMLEGLEAMHLQMRGYPGA